MRKRVLIVEDESLIAEDLKETVEELGHAVVGIAASGEEAIRRAVELRPDFLVMDISLAGGDMNGIEAAGRIQDLTSSTPVIFVSAILSIVNPPNYPHEFLPKPVDSKALERCIKRIVRDS